VEENRVLVQEQRKPHDRREAQVLVVKNETPLPKEEVRLGIDPIIDGPCGTVVPEVICETEVQDGSIRMVQQSLAFESEQLLVGSVALHREVDHLERGLELLQLPGGGLLVCHAVAKGDRVTEHHHPRLPRRPCPWVLAAAVPGSIDGCLRPLSELEAKARSRNPPVDIRIDVKVVDIVQRKPIEIPWIPSA